MVKRQNSVNPGVSIKFLSEKTGVTRGRGVEWLFCVETRDDWKVKNLDFDNNLECVWCEIVTLNTT
jgi:hypothetical protein